MNEKIEILLHAAKPMRLSELSAKLLGVEPTERQLALLRERLELLASEGKIVRTSNDSYCGRAAVERWMRARLNEHRDPLTLEVNCTGLVEAWDAEVADGTITLASDHPAWDIAVEVASVRTR